MGQPTGIGMVMGRLQPVLRLQRCRVGQMHPIAGLPQPINEPVPGGGGLSHHAHAVGLMRGSGLQNCGQMIGEALVRDHLILLIE